MTDEQDSGANEHEVPPEIPEVKGVKLVPSLQSQPATEADLHKVEQQMNAFERSTLRWTRASFFIVLATAIFIGLQWLEIRSGGADTHELAVHAKEQADKMKDMSDAADKIRQAAENMVTQDQRIADNAEKGIGASNKQTEAVLRENIEASHLDQRAWIGIRYSKLVPWPLVADKPISAEVGVLNTGKTNAQKSEIALHIAIRPKAIEEPPTDLTFTEPSKSVATIFPQLTMAANVTVKRADGTEVKPNDGDVTSFNAGDIKIFVWGEITCLDIFNKPHRTNFCSFFTGRDAMGTACATHNEAD